MMETVRCEKNLRCCEKKVELGSTEWHKSNSCVVSTTFFSELRFIKCATFALQL